MKIVQAKKKTNKQKKQLRNTEQCREVELSVAELSTALSKSLRSAVSAIQGTESFCFLVSKKFTIHTFYNQLISISTHLPPFT